MKVILTPRARQRLREIHEYIELENPLAAVKVVSRIRQVIDLLGDFPELGKVWENGPDRALSVSGLPYRIHYEIDQNLHTVHIITVAHHHQLYPSTRR